METNGIIGSYLQKMDVNMEDKTELLLLYFGFLSLQVRQTAMRRAPGPQDVPSASLGAWSRTWSHRDVRVCEGEAFG